MIILRQKEYSKLKAAKAVRNATNSILQGANKALPKALGGKKNVYTVARKAVKTGNATEKALVAGKEAVVDLGKTAKKIGVTAYEHPTKLVARGAEEIISRPIRSVSMPLVVLPEPITTAIGGAGVGVSNAVMKIPAVKKASGAIRKGVESTRSYKWMVGNTSKKLSPKNVIQTVFRPKQPILATA